jgi:hypothetical protein
MYMKSAEIRSHIEAKMGDARVDLYPFPHLIIENFFPSSVYDDMIRLNLFRTNCGVDWISTANMAATGNSTPYDHRKQINFHNTDPYDSDKDAKQFWEEIKRTFLGDSWFPKTVYNVFPQYFAIRFGEAVFRDDFWTKFHPELFLQRHEPNYYIGPHTDIASRVFTVIFSLASVNGYEEYGTQLLRHKDPYARSGGKTHHSFDNFEVVKTAEYKPNNLLLFFKTTHSFHAVKTITPDVPHGRFGMQYQFYEPRGGIFTELPAA